MYPHPSFASSQNNFTLTVDPQDATTLAFVPSQRKKRCMDGLSSWLEAWNVFLRSNLSLYPQLAPDLLAYQDQVCKFSRKFKASAWTMYDTAFRYMAASNTTMAWAKVNEQLYNDILKEETLPYCINCHVYGHRWLAPWDQSLLSPFVPTQPPPPPLASPRPSPALPSSHHRPSHFSKGAICRDFNCCCRPNCQFRHICNKSDCGGNHPGSQCPKVPPMQPHPPSLSPPSTLVNIINLTAELEHHPDQQYTASLLHSLQWRCNIGYTGPRFARITPSLKSAHLHPEAISAALAKEVSNGHTAGSFLSPPIPNLQCSPLGVVPKKDGSWRIIMDLSSPRGSSINDLIPKDDYMLHYASFNKLLL